MWGSVNVIMVSGVEDEDDERQCFVLLLGE